MVKITFKNVGQGDSIIIEWKEQEENKIGIIDCNIINGINPVLEYLKSVNCKTIDFVILSHPHFDHFSGLLDLFEWCYTNKIELNHFLITSDTTPEYITTALKTVSAKSTLAKIFQLSRKLRDDFGTKIFKIDDNPNSVKLIDDWKMYFLSPSSEEADNYLKDIKTFSREEDYHNNPKGNWLSTLIKIKKQNNGILLTSDIEKGTLTRMRKEKRTPEKIVLFQVPHHGSKKNHNNIFWSLSHRNPNTPAVISVGNNKYNHPSEQVINSLKGLQYSVFRTDQTSTISEIFNSKEYLHINAALDFISEVVERKPNITKGKDLVFTF